MIGAPLVLASGSPVRRRLLTRAGLAFVVDAADIDESARASEDLFARARRLARDKALHVAQRHAGALVIGCDQVGVLDDGRELTKPRDVDEAVAQLCAMSGRGHTFSSAAALVREGEVLAEVEQRAVVRFRRFDEAEARSYALLDEWRGSAGGYHLEGRGVRLVESVEGSENAVYGLPLLPLLDALERAGA